MGGLVFAFSDNNYCYVVLLITSNYLIKRIAQILPSLFLGIFMVYTDLAHDWTCGKFIGEKSASLAPSKINNIELSLLWDWHFWVQVL